MTIRACKACKERRTEQGRAGQRKEMNGKYMLHVALSRVVQGRPQLQQKVGNNRK